MGQGALACRHSWCRGLLTWWACIGTLHWTQAGERPQLCTTPTQASEMWAYAGDLFATQQRYSHILAEGMWPAVSLGSGADTSVQTPRPLSLPAIWSYLPRMKGSLFSTSRRRDMQQMVVVWWGVTPRRRT